MSILTYTLVILFLGAGLTIFAYLDRIFRELGRVVTGRLHAHLDIFEAGLEPRLHMDRRRANTTFSLLARFWLILVTVLTARAVIIYAGSSWNIAAELVFFLTLEVVVCMYLIPALLLARSRGHWLAPLLPFVRLMAWIVRPLQAFLAFAVSLMHLSDSTESDASASEQGAIEAIVEAATEEGILEQDEARLIEQVVEFSDKRVREVMTPRPDVAAISASSTIAQLRRQLVETKFSRLPVFENSLDDVIGVVIAYDVLQIPDSEAAARTVRELVRPALFVPETKMGSSLLKEMQRKSQQMAIVIDEYGSMAGIATVEDLVEEIVGEIGKEDRPLAPDVVREPGGSMVLRGSLAVDRLNELFDVDLAITESGSATIAGLLNHVVGHIPEAGEQIDFDSLQFEVLEANQRKVLRLRARRRAASASSQSAAS